MTDIQKEVQQIIAQSSPSLREEINERLALHETMGAIIIAQARLRVDIERREQNDIDTLDALL